MPESQSSPTPFAFVIMPFSDAFEEVYAKLLRPALSAAGYEPSRADTDPGSRNIMKDVISGLTRADLVVTDLSGLNPNVLYELGLAHGMRKPVLLLIQDLEELFFDLRAYRVIQYGLQFTEAETFRLKLEDTARKILQGAIAVDNPVTDFEPKTAGLTTSIPGAPAEREGPNEEAGFLDLLEESERSMLQIGKHMENLTAVSMEYTGKAKTRIAEVQEAGKSDLGRRTNRFRTIAAAMATDLTGYMEGIDKVRPELRSSFANLEQSSLQLYASMSIGSREDLAAALKLQNQFEGFKIVLHKNTTLIRTARDSVTGGLRGISRDLNQAASRAGETLNGLVEDLTTAESKMARISGLLDKRIADAKRISEQTLADGESQR